MYVCWLKGIKEPTKLHKKQKIHNYRKYFPWECHACTCVHVHAHTHKISCKVIKKKKKTGKNYLKIASLLCGLGQGFPKLCLSQFFQTDSGNSWIINLVHFFTISLLRASSVIVCWDLQEGSRVGALSKMCLWQIPGLTSFLFMLIPHPCPAFLLK